VRRKSNITNSAVRGKAWFQLRGRYQTRGLMTEIELNRQIEASEQQRADLLPPQPKRRTGRAYRRMMNERKYKHLFKIVTHGYRPHAGYVDWSYVDGKWMPTGKYIKYPKNSNCQNWCKKASSARVRKYMDLPHKGNSYRRVFDYWWTLY